MKNALRGKLALVTGATGGLGAALARKLAARGCRLVLTGRRQEALSTLADELARAGAEAVPVTADLAVTSDLERLAARAGESGPVGILVNCAGIFPVAPLRDSTVDDFDRCFAVNVRAPFFLCRAFAPAMAEAGWGRLVNIGSSSAYSGFRDTSVYCASKHALLGLSRSLHDELKGRNVRVLCISPGSVQTPMGRQVRGQDFETFLDPDEIAELAADLMCLDGPMIAEEIRLNRMVIR